MDINFKLFSLIAFLFLLFLFFGCTGDRNSQGGILGQSVQDSTKQQYFSFVEKYILDKHNYIVDYEVVDNSPPQTEQYDWANGSAYVQKFTPVMKLDAMTVYFLNDGAKFNIRTDFNILTNLTNTEHTTQIIPMQNFILSDYNKSFVCGNGKCVEQKMNNPLALPSKEEAMAILNDKNISIELLPKIVELPSDATCFRLVEQKMIQCFLADGVLAYLGNGTAHIKIKTIQRDVLTDMNFALPRIPEQS